MEMNKLIQHLRFCGDLEANCHECEQYYEMGADGGTASCVNDLMQKSADALEDQQKRIAELEAQNRWIPVTERLPQDDLPVGALCEVVQVLLQGGAVTVGWCNRGLKCWYYLPINDTKFVGHGYDLTPVVAWKPLDQPPKEGV